MAHLEKSSGAHRSMLSVMLCTKSRLEYVKDGNTLVCGIGQYKPTLGTQKVESRPLLRDHPKWYVLDPQCSNLARLRTTSERTGARDHVSRNQDPDILQENGQVIPGDNGFNLRHQLLSAFNLPACKNA